MNVYRCPILFCLSTILIQNYVDGSPIGRDEGPSKSKTIVLDKLVLEAIEESITQYLSKMSLPFLEETEKSEIWQETSRVHSSASEVANAQNPASFVVFLDESVQNAINISIKQNISEFLHESAVKRIQELENSQTTPTTTDSQPIEAKSFAEAVKTMSHHQPEMNKEKNILDYKEGRSSTEKATLPKFPFIIVPKNDETEVLVELRALRINMKSFGVLSTYLSPTGTLLVECDSEEGRKAFIKRISQSSQLEIKPPRARFPNQVRFDVPREITEEQIHEAVLQNFKEEPLAVEFIPFKGRTDYKVALVEVSNEVFKKMEAYPTIFVGTMRRRIDTSIRVERCKQCQLLGHRAKFCHLPFRRPPLPNENCIDCVYYNKNRQGMDSKPRDVNHPTNHDSCQTKKELEEVRRKNTNIAMDDEELNNDEVPTPSVNVPSEAPERKQAEGKDTFAMETRSFAQALRSLSTLGSSQARPRNTETFTGRESEIPKLLYPIVIISKNPKIDAIDELHNADINLNLFGVRVAHLSPTGSLFLECDSEKGKERLWKAITRSRNLDVVPGVKKFPNEARIDVPQNATAVEVSDAVHRTFKQRPLEVRFMPVSLKHKSIKVAILHVSNSLMKKMEASPFVDGGRIQSDIDVSIYVDRCDKCQLLGHRKKFCRLPARSPAGPRDRCIDCSYYNAHLPRLRLINLKPRNADHRTHDISCPTRQYFIEKWRRNRGADDDALEEEGDSSGNSSPRSTASVNTIGSASTPTSVASTLHNSAQNGDIAASSTSSTGKKSFAEALQTTISSSVEQRNDNSSANSSPIGLSPRSAASISSSDSAHFPPTEVRSSASALQEDKPDITVGSTSPPGLKTFAKVLQTPIQPNVVSPTPQPEQIEKEQNAERSSKSLSDEIVRPTLVIVSKIPGKNVREELRNLGINLKTYGVKTSYPSPTGSLQVECDSEEGREALWQALKRSRKLDIRPPRKKFPHEVRVDVPERTTADQISRVIFENYGQYPSQVTFIPLKTKWKKVKIALLYVSDSLFNKIEKSPHLSAGWLQSTIDTRIRVDRCENCQLLGHRGKFCTLPNRSFPSPRERCIDCSYYNKHLRDKNSKPRNENHPTDDDDCPTKQYFVDRWRRSRGTDDETFENVSIKSTTEMSSSQVFTSAQQEANVTTSDVSSASEETNQKQNLSINAEAGTSFVQALKVEERNKSSTHPFRPSVLSFAQQKDSAITTDMRWADVVDRNEIGRLPPQTLTPERRDDWPRSTLSDTLRPSVSSFARQKHSKIPGKMRWQEDKVVRSFPQPLKAEKSDDVSRSTQADALRPPTITRNARWADIADEEEVKRSLPQASKVDLPKLTRADVFQNSISSLAGQKDSSTTKPMRWGDMVDEDEIELSSQAFKAENTSNDFSRSTQAGALRPPTITRNARWADIADEEVRRSLPQASKTDREDHLPEPAQADVFQSSISSLAGQKNSSTTKPMRWSDMENDAIESSLQTLKSEKRDDSADVLQPLTPGDFTITRSMRWADIADEEEDS